jgi:hypothetical protein
MNDGTVYVGWCPGFYMKDSYCLNMIRYPPFYSVVITDRKISSQSSFAVRFTCFFENGDFCPYIP